MDGASRGIDSAPPNALRARAPTAGLLALATLLAMSAWFSTGAVAPALQAARGYSGGALTWMAVAVQAGFVTGTLALALSNAPDRFRPHRIFMLGALGAAIAAISLLPDQPVAAAIASRFAIGLSLAAVYPVGLKILAGWYRGGRGLILGVMVGALALGSGLPHLFGSVFNPDWQPAIIGAAAATVAGGVIVYSFWLILATLSFWFVRVENILIIFQGVYEAGRWPVGMYPLWLQVALTALVPVAFAVTVPAEAVVGRLTGPMLALALGLALGLLVGARWFWNCGVKRYSGASA